MDLSGTHDIVIVGSGAGGAAAAWRLCTLGLKVLLLEAGPAFDAQTDYPLDRPGWERRGFPVKEGSQTQITFGDLGTLEAEFEDLVSWSRAGFPWRLPTGSARPSSATGYSYVMGVGGSTLHYVGEAHRLHPDAFRLRSITGRGADWPIEYADLEPYYTLAEKVLGVAGEASEDGRWRTSPYPLPPHPLSPGAGALQEAGARIGQTWSVNPRAALSVPYDDRPPCNYCGHCARGCPLGDKGSSDVTFLRAAAKTGNLELVSDATATRLISGRSGGISHLEFIHGGETHRVETPVIVLTCGAVQTPRLLFLSADADSPDGLGNSSAEVGRNFMETLSWRSAGLLPSLRNSHKGLPADLACFDQSAPGQVPGLPGGFRLSHGTQELGLNGPIGYGTRLVDGFGAGFKTAMRSSFGSAVAVGAVGQIIPDERSRITLNPEVLDRHGLPAAQINSVLTRDSLLLLRQMAGAARTVLNETGAVVAEEAGSWDGFSASHVFGTARMGDDPRNSVVDASGRSHDHPNLWITDASVFPTSGGGEAPALTIMALAMRSADAIMA